MKIIFTLLVLGLIIMACTTHVEQQNPSEDNVVGDAVNDVDQLMNELDNIDAELNFDELDNMDLSLE